MSERAAAAIPADLVRRRRRAVSLLLLAVAAASAALVPLSFLLLAFLRDLPGDVDALLASHPCHPRAPDVGDGGGDGGGGGGPSTGACDGGVGGGGGGAAGGARGRGWRDRLVRSLARRTLLPVGCRGDGGAGNESADVGGGAGPCAEGEEERFCRMCAGYRQVRAHVRVGELTLDPGWWLRREFRASNVSVTSRRGTFVQRPSSGRGDGYWPGERDVLRLDVVDGFGGGGAGAAPPPPLPPAFEIGALGVRWSSWTRPVVDVRASGVTFHVVVGTDRSARLGVPLPAVSVGDTPLDEALEMLPDPPEEEGTYPRVGVVDVTDVRVLLHVSPDRSSAEAGDSARGAGAGGWNCSDIGAVDAEDDSVEQRTVQFAKIDVPNEYFEALRDATSAAIPAGIDQFHFNSVVENAIKGAIRHQLLREEDLRDFLDHLLEMSDALKKDGLEKLKGGAHFLDAFISEGRAALDHWWQDLQQEWKEKNKQLGAAMKKFEENCENFLRSIHFEPPHLDRYVDDLAKALRDFKKKRTDWKVIFPKVADEWKKGWTEFEKSWTHKAVPHVDSFVADLKDELKKLQRALKEKLQIGKS